MDFDPDAGLLPDLLCTADLGAEYGELASGGAHRWRPAARSRSAGGAH